MPKKLALTLAAGDYEIIRPLLRGKVEVDGVDLTILTDMDSATRHWRFLNNGEFDIAEVSGSSYLAARDNDLPFRAVPVFLHRRFRHGFMFINTSKGISKPADLRGRKIGVKTMMTTAVLWMRGILQHEYGVPLNSIEWVAEIEDDVKVALPADIKYSCLPDNKSVETMLAEGELDAVFHSDFVKPFVARDPRVARLFPDHKAEEMAYFKRTGIFPIMHVLGIRQSLADEHPWLAVNLFRAFNEAKAVAMKRMANPRIVPLAWYRDAWEEQERVLGPDPWEYGLSEKNRKVLDTLVGYSHEQGLIKKRPSARAPLSQCRPGPQARRRVQDLDCLPSWPGNRVRPLAGPAVNLSRPSRLGRQCVPKRDHRDKPGDDKGEWPQKSLIVAREFRRP